MRKLLIMVLIVLLCVLGYFAIFSGISIGSFQILSTSQIKDKNDKLDEEISQIETDRETTYPNKTSELKKETTTMMDAKKTYLDLASVSTESELKEANQEETYLIEFLWTKIGNHATNEGVKLKLDVVSGDTGESDVHNLNFTVTGHYIAIINFISAIENDSKLGFRIENFKMVPGGDDLTATFTTTGIRIKTEETTTTVDTPTTTDTNTTTNTTTEGTTTNTES
jgi:uncharacterized protein YdcH (DUF465 family)